MDIFLAGALTWLLASAIASIYFNREYKTLLADGDQDEYIVAVRYLSWANKTSLRARARKIRRFLAAPLFLTAYLHTRDRARAQISEEMQATVEAARELMRLRYQGSKPWLHPADLYDFRLKYMEWFHDSQAAAMKKFQRRMRFGMYGKAIHQAKKHLPCQCPQPLRKDVEEAHDVCTCGGLLPKDPSSLVL